MPALRPTPATLLFALAALSGCARGPVPTSCERLQRDSDLLQTALQIAVRARALQGDDTLTARDLRRRFACLAEDLRGRLPVCGSPQQKLAALRETIHGRFDIHPVRTQDPAALSFLDSILLDRRGACLALVTLYVCLGQEVGLPVSGVLAPDHVFVRYDDGRDRLNLETLRRGALRTDDDYRRRFRIAPDDAGFGLETLSNDELAGLLHYNLGHLLRRHGKDTPAHQAFADAVKLFPRHAPARAAHAVMALRKGDPQTAAAELRQVLQDDPALPEAHYWLGVTLMRLERWAPAESALRQATSRSPDHARAWAALATVLEQRGRTDAASEARARVKALDPSLWREVRTKP